MFPEIKALKKRIIPAWKKKSAIVLTPPFFILLVLAPALIFWKRTDIFLNLPVISRVHFNVYLGVPIFVFGVVFYAWTVLLFAKFGQGTQTPFILPRIHYKLAKSLLYSGITALIIFAIAVFVGFLDIFLGLRPFNFISTVTTTVGAFFLVLGFILRTWATLIFYQKKLKIISLIPQQYLITSGPYRLSRNPLYLGVFFMILGIIFILGSPAILIISVIFFYLWNKHIVPIEENDLEEVFGQKYLDYKKTVPRWL